MPEIVAGGPGPPDPPPPHRRSRRLLGLALAVAVGGTGVGLAVGLTGSGRPAGSRPPAPAPWSARVVLPATTMKAGSTMEGEVVVDNRSGAPRTVTGCGSLFQIVLGNHAVRQEPGWAACAQPFTIPAGRSTYPVTVSARYLGCSMRPTGALPVCVDGAPPPLPPGVYEATLAQNPPVVPVPPPSTLRLTR